MLRSFFKKGSIRRKLRLVNYISMAAVLVLMAVALIADEYSTFRKNLVADLSSQADFIANNSIASLLFNDPRRAETALSFLNAYPNIEQAIIYSWDGVVFAKYQRGNAPFPGLQKDGYMFAGEHLDLFRSVVSDGDTIGGVYIRSNTKKLYQSLLRKLGFEFIVAVVSLMVALTLLSRLQKAIIDPIFGLLDVMHTVSKDKDYTIRADQNSEGELGLLARGFNDMLAQIQTWNSELEYHRLNLERLVEMRTSELCDANLKLQEELRIRRKAEEDLQSAKEEAEKANNAKTEFLTNMSHEIRTPMNAVIGMSEFMLHTPLTVEQQDCVVSINNAADSLLRLLNEILDLSKIESGKMELEDLDFKLKDVTESAVKTFNAQARAKGLQLECVFDPDADVTVRGDPTKLRQVLLNLIGNAIKFTEQGTVRVEVKEKAPELTSSCRRMLFAVSDTGIGIPQGKLTSIFDVFTQADGSTSRKYGGTGLGLNISRELVTLMGGVIWVESREGKGSVFYFELPFADAFRESPEEEGSPLMEEGTPPLPLRVLVVEDLPLNQKVAALFLRKRGHQVTIADSGVKALEVLSKEDFDLVLMDVQMPEMDGFEATKRIRDPLSPVRRHDVPIVAITAHAMHGDRERCLSEGMDDYVSKPFSMREFYRVVERFWPGRASVPPADLPADRLTAEDGAQVIDRQALSDRYCGNEEVIREICSAFLENVSRTRLDDIRAAVDDGDAGRLRIMAHSLKGAAGTVGAELLEDTALRIELAARDGALQKARGLLNTLEYEYDRAISCLRNNVLG